MTDQGQKGYRTDVALLSVTDTEFNAVKLFHDWEDFTLEGDGQLYQRSAFERDGKSYSLVHAKIDSMGMTAAAAASMKMIDQFRPRYLIMVGIAAGIALSEYVEQLYGEVIVPDIVWN